MNMDAFLERFLGQLEETDPAEVTPTTQFRNLAEWSSIAAISIIAMVESEYGVKLKGDDIKRAQTVFDIYNIVIQKQQGT